MKRLAPVVAAALLGCAVGPDYERPQTEVPAQWRIDYPKAADVANTRWWEQFGDPVLNQLIEEALRENRDVRIAAARVDQFIGALRSLVERAKAGEAEHFKAAPHLAPRRRLDETLAARKPVLTWTPPELAAAAE